MSAKTKTKNEENEEEEKEAKRKKTGNRHTCWRNRCHIRD